MATDGFPDGLPADAFPETPTDRTYIAEIARALDQAGIPNVLWGYLVLAVYGAPTNNGKVGFVVDDDKVDLAYSTLRGLDYTPCADPLTCMVTYGHNGHHSFKPPSAHVHINYRDSIDIYKKSEILWKLPSLELSAPDNVLGPDIILASDPRLPQYKRLGKGQGAFQKSEYPVRIPSVHRFVEALIRLKKWNLTHMLQYVPYWAVMLTYVDEIVDDDGLFDVNYLEPSCRKWYLKSLKGPMKSMDLVKD